MALTPKQQRFVEEYLIDLNATQAAIRAGYAAGSAAVAGARLLTYDKISAAVAKAVAKRSEKTGIDAEWLLKRLGNEVEADLADLYADDGNLKPVHEWPLIWRQGLVAGIESVEDRDPATGEVIGIIRKVRLSDRVKRLELAGKHVDVQAFREQVAQTGTLTLNVLPEDAGL